jgi:hypothetical protein
MKYSWVSFTPLAVYLLCAYVDKDLSSLKKNVTDLVHSTAVYSKA